MDKKQKLAQEYGVPYTFNILTRRGIGETTLTLEEVNKDLDGELEFVYRFSNPYFYQPHMEDNRCVAIDFSETDMIYLGDIMQKDLIVTEIIAPYIIFKKK